MTYYGPWQAGIELVQTINMQTNESVWSNGDTSLASEWGVQYEMPWGVAESAGKGFDGGLDDPPDYEPEISQDAWDQMLLAQPEPGGGGGGDTEISQTANKTIPSVGRWNITELWSASGVIRPLTYGADGYPSLGLSGVPPFEEWPSGATTAQLETPEHPNDVLTLIDGWILPPLAPPAPFKFIVKGPGAGAWFDGETSLNVLRAMPGFMYDTDPPLPLDVAALNALVDYDTSLPTPESQQYPLDPVWPAIATVYGDEWPGWYGEPPTSLTFDDTQWPRIQLTYRASRYRYGYDTPQRPPYRRTYPRDDGLAGGAPRTWPPSKSIQSSNRTYGGYL